MVYLKKLCFGFVIFLVVSVSIGFVSAFEFNGTVYDINGNALNDSIINITIRNSDFTVNGYNSTGTNETGWFNFSVADITGAFYDLEITHFNGSAIDYVGQSLPAFPSNILTEIAGTTFYLREGGTINMTAINSSGARTTFNYQVKDQKLGYPIAENFNTKVNEAIVYVPRDRNYSIMIYPDQSMPVSFDWNNLTASVSYNITVTNLSEYDFDTKTLQYQFNTTLTMKRVSGFIDYGSFTGWDEFTVVPYLLEPGNMIHSDFGDLPYNLSSFISETDSHNLTDGFYNISLPGTAETSSIMLFASARNGSQYIGGFRNLSLTTSSIAETTVFNFSNMAGLLGVASNISMDTITGSQINISAAQQTFGLVNVTNSSLSSASGHIETTVDYSSYGTIEFTWMSDIGQDAATPTFSVPLLNITGIKEMNIYAGGGNYAPRRLSQTVSELQTDNLNNGNVSNITLTTFNPGDIEGGAASISMSLYISNSSCDIPSPGSGCVVGGTDDQDLADFDPFKAIFGGGKLSFRMGTGNIAVHYVNVDMLASGPPDALFDNSNTDSGSSSSFDQAVRFGSGGPTIYDYVLVSIPYSETAGSGLNDNAEVNMTLPLFYDDNWNVIWNSTANGTNAADLAGNYSHYSTYSGDWSQLMNDTVCTTAAITSASMINASSPCYIDTTTNRVWIRLPHFSGAGPSITGSVVAAASSSSSSSSSGGGSGTTSFWTSTFAYDSLEFGEREPLTREYQVGYRVRIKLNGEIHYIGIVGLTATSATVNVSSKPEQATLNIGESEKFDVIDDGFYDILVALNGIVNDKANITISPIHEEVPEVVVPDGGDEEGTGDGGGGTEGGEEGTGDGGGEGGRGLGWVLIIVIVVLIGVGVTYYSWRGKGK